MTITPRVLAPDLRAFEKYYEKFDSDLTAFIYWPHDITFQVKWVEYKTTRCLQIQGEFVRSVFGIASQLDYIYFKKTKFYYKKKGKMTFLSADNVLYYNQPTFFEKEDSYLAIAYHTLEDLKTISRDVYTSHAIFFDKYPSRMRSVYVASWDYPVKHLLEYTFGGPGIVALYPEGGLVSLIGKTKKNKLEMKNYRNEIGDRIVYNPAPEGDLIVITGFPDVLRVQFHAKDIFGVRMQSQAFLAEVRAGQLRMLSARHLEARQPEKSLDKEICLYEFTPKLLNVEPRFCDSEDEFCMLGRPKQVKFFFKGHVFVKKVNYKESSQGELQIDDDCPIGIEFENKEMAFHFGNDRDMMICTNEEDHFDYWRSNGEKIYQCYALHIGPNTVIY